MTRTPEGAASFWIKHDVRQGEVRAEAWGEGAGWVLDHIGDLLGEEDDPAALAEMTKTRTSENGLITDALRRFPGLRMPKTLALFEALVPTILEQKVTGREARQSYRRLVLELGEPAPGPPELFGDLRVPPSAEVLAVTPYWVFHRVNVELKRTRTVIEAAQRASSIDALAGLRPAEARTRLMSLPGIGEWTAAEVALVALGDPDAVSIGDYHVPHQVTYAFTGRRRGDDQGMLELLEPYRGQRGRVVRLIQAAGYMPPRRGPRMARRDFSRW